MQEYKEQTVGKSEFRLQQQIVFCQARNIPMFAPVNGICFSCGEKIADSDNEHITGCKQCFRSFVE